MCLNFEVFCNNFKHFHSDWKFRDFETNTYNALIRVMSLLPNKFHLSMYIETLLCTQSSDIHNLPHKLVRKRIDYTKRLDARGEKT